jgi:hypothetical protein
MPAAERPTCFPDIGYSMKSAASGMAPPLHRSYPSVLTSSLLYDVWHAHPSVRILNEAGFNLQPVPIASGLAVKGNVVDMTVGVIIGGAFGEIVSSLVTDVVLPTKRYC